MSEKLYQLLLKLYPDHFRRAYGDEALRLVRDRARDEKGLLSGLRLWLDLLVDLAISLPREYSKAPATPIAALHRRVNGDPSFQLLAEPSLEPAGSAASGRHVIGGIVLGMRHFRYAHSRTYPAAFQDSHSLQWLVQSDLALARSPYPACRLRARTVSA